jgi:hypothetical protein
MSEPFVAVKRRQALDAKLTFAMRSARTARMRSSSHCASATSVADICSALNLSTNREARLRVTFFTGTGHGLGYPFDNCRYSREVRNGRHSQSYFTRNRR